MFGIVTSTVFLGMVGQGVRGFVEMERGEEAELRRRREAGEDYLPAVSLLKPLHGAEPDLEKNLRTFYEQDYFQLRGDRVAAAMASGGGLSAELAGDVEILFCARTEADGGLAIARKVAAEYPHVTTRIVTSGEPWGPNAKVCSLVAMARAAANDLWVISDSDVGVTPEYLRRVVMQFADPRVGCVTCLYRGYVPFGGFWSRLEAVGMTIEMSSGVAVANLLEPMQFALGPTMATRRGCVEGIGGFEEMVDFCADDFLLGNRVALKGHEVRLTGFTLDHMVLHASFMESMKHQVRWMKSTRFSRPKGHFGTSLTYGLPYGVMAGVGLAMLGHAWWGVAAFAWTMVARMIQAWGVGRFVVHKRKVWPTMMLFPLRDFMGFFLWALSYTSRRILWRGEVYELMEEGRMRKAE